MAESAVTHATEADLASLCDIVPRAFHKSNDYFRKTLPDTPIIRRWWSGIFLDTIRDPVYQVLVIVDSNADSLQTRSIIGVLLLRLLDGSGLDKSVFFRHHPTADHDLTRYKAMLEPELSPGETQSPQKKYMSGRRHFAIELFGVDDKHQGTGLGKTLLRKACEVSDAEGVEIFVQANLKAKSFYEKCGFVSKHQIMLPGDDGYGEAFLIYGDEKSERQSSVER